MRPLSERVAGLEESATIAISDKAKRMQREGIDVISLSIGEPDFDTPAHIKQACINAINGGYTHYTPSNGIPELLSAVAEKITTENKFPCKPAEVMITCGAKDAIFDTMAAVINPGDEVILFDPAWVSYEPCIRMAGGNVVHCPVDQNTFQVDERLLEKITKKTKMIVINSPSNPTGAVLDDKSQKLVADACEDHDLYAMSDEIYEKLVYDGARHISLASIRDMARRTITVNGFSKAYAMTGWRLGYAVAPVEILKEMSKIQQHSVSHPASFAMYAGVEALKGDQTCIEEMRQEFDRRRRYMIGELNKMGYKTAPAQGAFYAFLKVNGNDMEISSRWLEKGHVAATPGSAFYAPGWIRLSYATSMEKLKEAMDRIRRVG
jgi:aspartate aminotransferase